MNEELIKKLIDLLERYKFPPPSDILSSPYYQENVIYWLLLKLIHLGKPEQLSVLAHQLGIEPDKLLMAIEAISVTDSSFPLEIGRRLRVDTVILDHDIVEPLREAALKSSPEHMPPQSIRRLSQDKIDKWGTEYFFHVFSSKDVRYPVKDILSLVEATEGLEDAEIMERHNDAKLISILTPSLRVVIMPVVGTPEIGYYCDRLEVLDIRDEALHLASAVYPQEKILPIVVSLGFTYGARQACLNPQKVLLIELWAFLRIIGCLQVISKRGASHKAFAFIQTSLVEPTTEQGYFYPDGFAKRTIEYLGKTYDGACL